MLKSLEDKQEIGVCALKYYVIALLVIILDQWTKWLVITKMTFGESIKVIDHFLYITSVRNRGAAWSILQGQMVFFALITVAVVFVVIYYIQKRGRYQPLLGIALGLILGGTFGNFIDRMFRGEVVDFINTYIFTYDFPVFNIADSALCVGAILIVLYTLIESKKEKLDE